jgi:hypothetical protein
MRGLDPRMSKRTALRCDGKPQMEMGAPLHFQPTRFQITLQ